nr:MAG TPA: hypothetical protein [Caudoviricetes sp.]
MCRHTLVTAEAFYPLLLCVYHPRSSAYLFYVGVSWGCYFNPYALRLSLDFTSDYPLIDGLPGFYPDLYSAMAIFNRVSGYLTDFVCGFPQDQTISSTQRAGARFPPRVNSGGTR